MLSRSLCHNRNGCFNDQRVEVAEWCKRPRNLLHYVNPKKYTNFEQSTIQYAISNQIQWCHMGILASQITGNLFKNLFRVNSKETRKPRITGPSWGQSTDPNKTLAIRKVFACGAIIMRVITMWYVENLFKFMFYTESVWQATNY